MGDKNYWPEPPTDDEIEMYEVSGRREDGPTPINFRLDFSHHPPKRSVWNRRAAEVFVEQYRLSNYPDRAHDGVEDEFWKRLQRLSQKYHDHDKSFETGSAAKNPASGPTKRQRRQRRVHTVSHFQIFSQYRPHVFHSFSAVASPPSSPTRRCTASFQPSATSPVQG